LRHISDGVEVAGDSVKDVASGCGAGTDVNWTVKGILRADVIVLVQDGPRNHAASICLESGMTKSLGDEINYRSWSLASFRGF